MSLPSGSSPLPPGCLLDPPEIDPEVWTTCAGPLIHVPPPNTLAVYCPLGHAEHVSSAEEAAAVAAVTQHPSQIICRVLQVTAKADVRGEDLSLTMKLQAISECEMPLVQEAWSAATPVTTSEDDWTPRAWGAASAVWKVLSKSDASLQGGLSLPKQAAMQCLAPLDMTQTMPNQLVQATDLFNRVWHFRHVYRGSPKRHLLSTNWNRFLVEKQLQESDRVAFIRGAAGTLKIGIRRSIPHLDSARGGVSCAEILQKASQRDKLKECFEVTYHVRSNPSAYPMFVVPLDDVCRAVKQVVRMRPRQRVKFMLETTDFGIRRLTGKSKPVVVTSELRQALQCRTLDLRQLTALWRCVEVEWRDADHQQSGMTLPSQVSPWEITPLELRRGGCALMPELQSPEQREGLLLSPQASRTQNLTGRRRVRSIQGRVETRYQDEAYGATDTCFRRSWSQTATQEGSSSSSSMGRPVSLSLDPSASWDHSASSFLPLHDPDPSSFGEQNLPLPLGSLAHAEPLQWIRPRKWAQPNVAVPWPGQQSLVPCTGLCRSLQAPVASPEEGHTVGQLTARGAHSHQGIGSLSAASLGSGGLDGGEGEAEFMEVVTQQRQQEGVQQQPPEQDQAKQEQVELLSYALGSLASNVGPVEAMEPSAETRFEFGVSSQGTNDNAVLEGGQRGEVQHHQHKQQQQQPLHAGVQKGLEGGGDQKPFTYPFPPSYHPVHRSCDSVVGQVTGCPRLASTVPQFPASLSVSGTLAVDHGPSVTPAKGMALSAGATNLYFSAQFYTKPPEHGPAENNASQGAPTLDLLSSLGKHSLYDAATMTGTPGPV